VDVCLVLPEVCTAAMSVFLTHFVRALPAAQHAVLVLDQAGWPGAKALQGPTHSRWFRCRPTVPNSTPSSGSGCTLREPFLSHRVLEGYDEIVAACCQAFNALTPERLRSRTNQPWIQKVTS
jgi:hypothetical protein